MTTLRRVATTRGGAGFPHAEQGLESGELPFIKVSDFNHPGNERTVTRCANWVSRSTARRLGASIVPSGALLMPKVGAAMLGNARRLTSQPSVFDNNVLAVVPSGIGPRYLHYWLGTVDAAVFAKPGPIPSMGDDALLDLVVPVGGLAEQRAIANYLDAETARIDALIAKKQQLIHLLEERRSAFVSTAVTVGLERRQTIDTGDDLVPQIPSGWRLISLRHLVERIVDTPHKTAPVVDGERYLVVRTANVKNGRLVYTDARYTDVESWGEWNRRGEPRIGDVLFTREAPAGEACVVPAGQPLCLGQRMVLFQVDRRWTTGGWLVHSIYSGPAQRFIKIYSNSTTVAHLNMSDIPDIPIVAPPLDEQSRLLAAIEHVDDTVHRSKKALARQIDLLAEHRQALITAAVTGGCIVPGAC